MTAALWRGGLALCLATVACGGRSAEEGAVVTKEVDLSGFLRVANSVRSEVGAHFSHSLEVIWSSDARHGTNQDGFLEVRDIAVDRGGDVYVLDGLAMLVHVLDKLDGRPTVSFGGLGAGPGELKQPLGLLLDGEGDVWVADAGNGRYSIFAPDGEFLRTVPRKMEGALPWAGTVDREGRILDVGFRTLQDGEGLEPFLVRFDPRDAAVVADTFALPHSPESFFSIPGTGLRGWVPFSPRMLRAVDPEGEVWFGINSEYTITRRTFEGDTVSITTLDRSPVVVSEEEKEATLADLAAFGVKLAEGALPGHHPLFQLLHRDDDDRLWILSTVPQAGFATVLDIFQNEVYLGSVGTDLRISAQVPLVSQGDTLHAVVLDSLDVPSVAKLLLKRSFAGDKR